MNLPCLGTLSFEETDGKTLVTEVTVE